MELPYYIQKAVDLGLIEIKDGKIVKVDKDAVETTVGVARIVEKLQPTTIVQKEDTYDQEAIVLCRVLSSPSGVARELWSNFALLLASAMVKLCLTIYGAILAFLLSAKKLI